MTEIYRAGSQLIKVRAIMLLSLASAVAACWYGWVIFQSYGLRPADGGVLAPLGTRLAFGGGIALLGLAFAAGMALYGRLYATRIDYDEAAGALHIRTAGFVTGAESVHPVSDVLESDWMAGRFDNPAGVSVDAPWIKLRLSGRSWPLIVDAQGRFPDRALAAKLLRLG